MEKLERQHLELGLLRTFLAVAHHGSLGRTATAMAMTQPAVSQQVSRLEKIVGRTLFERGRNGVKLTHHGELLVSYANRALDLSEETLLRLRADSASGCIRLGMSAEIAAMGLIPVLTNFRKAHPEIDARVMVADSARLDRMLQKGEADLAICDQASLTGTPTVQWRANLTWVGAKEFRLGDSRVLPLVLFEGRSAWRDELLGSLRKAGWEWRIVFESASLDAILAALESGMGVCPLSPQLIVGSPLEAIEDSGLPAPPSIQFGMFRGKSGPSPARAAMEAAFASAFRVRKDSSAARDSLTLAEHANRPRSAALGHNWLRVGQA